MRIRVLRNLGQGHPPFKEGECPSVDRATGERLLALGLAESLPAEPRASPLDETPVASAETPTGVSPVARSSRKLKKPSIDTEV